MNQETITFNTSSYFNSISGVFMTEKLKTGSTVIYNNKSYEVVSNITFQARYYPQSNVLLFRVGEQSFNSVSKVRTLLAKGGIASISEFNRTYMNGASAFGTYMFKDIVFVSFEKLSIFDM